MARGAPGAPALDMSKYLDTNYHYLVPELEEGFEPQPDFAPILERLARGQAAVGKDAAVPMVVSVALGAEDGGGDLVVGRCRCCAPCSSTACVSESLPPPLSLSPPMRLRATKQNQNHNRSAP